MKCIKRFIKVDSPNLYAVYFKAVSVFIILAFSKFLLGNVFFEERHSCLHCFYNKAIKFMMPNTSF